VECSQKCGMMLSLNDISKHIVDDCPRTMINCKNDCGLTLERGELMKHLNFDCQNETIDCPNKSHNVFEQGCTVRMKRREMGGHSEKCEYRKVMCENHKCNNYVYIPFSPQFRSLLKMKKIMI
jgi:hypothetical protein